MRSDFLIALLICGTLIVALPPISDQMDNQTRVALLSRPNAQPSDAYVEGMSSDYRVGCYLLGAVMIATAVIGSLMGRSRAAVPAVERRPDPRLAETVVAPGYGERDV